MSPRNPPLPLQQVPDTPTQSHAIPPMRQPPHPSAPQPLPSVTSPLFTPSTTSRSTLLSTNAGAFVPTEKVSIKTASGREVTLDTLKRAPPSTIPPQPASPASVKKDIKRQPIRIESQEQKEKCLAEERAKEGEIDDKSKSSDGLARANEAAARREFEEQERPKEQERNLLPVDVTGLEPTDTFHTISWGGSGHNRHSNSLSMPLNTRSASIGLGFISPSMDKSSGSGFQMGKFSTSGGRMSSEERFLAASTARFASVTGGLPRGRHPTMVRTIHQSGTGRERTRSKRNTADLSRTSVAGNAGHTMPVFIMGHPMEHVAPLEISENRWVASSTRCNGSGVDTDSPEMVDHKVNGLLNKLTMERFDSISDQIIAWANKSERENDGRTLAQVIKLVFEMATNGRMFSEMYAHLCRKMMERISPKVQDDGIKNAEGKPFAGGQLFRKYLLNRCQQDFERGWVAKETTAAASATKVTEDQAIKEANEKTKGEDAELYLDEVYAAAKERRRGLGVIRFIGELFKLRMLTERIMHECIMRLLGNVETPESASAAIEKLCELLTTVGSLLDTQKARAHLDVYFLRMRELMKNKNVNARMMFMLQVCDISSYISDRHRPMQFQDVIELRERRWVPRNAVAALRAPARRPPKAGDLSQFGKISKATPMTFRPGSIFTSKKGTDSKNRGPPMSRISSTSSNMFSMLQNLDAVVEPAVSKGSRPPSRKPSVDLGAEAASELAPQRRRLQLLPRSSPVGEESKVSTPTVSESGSDDEATGETGLSAPPALSEAKAKAKIEEDTKEFFSIRMLDEAESYFYTLPTEHRHWLVNALVTKSIEMKEPDVVLVSELFARVREKELCSLGTFDEGFNGFEEALDDLSVDIPRAWTYFAILLRGSGLDQVHEEKHTLIISVG